MKKRNLTLSGVLIFLLNVIPVNAAILDARVFSSARDLLLILFRVTDSSTETLLLFARIVIFMLVTILSFAVLDKYWKKESYSESSSKGSLVIAFVIGWSASILLSNETLLLVYGTYTSILVAITFLLPAIGLLYLNFKILPQHLMSGSVGSILTKIAIYICVLLLLGTMQTGFETLANGGSSQVRDVAEDFTSLNAWAILLTLFVLIYELFRLLYELYGLVSGSSVIRNLGRSIDSDLNNIEEESKVPKNIAKDAENLDLKNLAEKAAGVAPVIAGVQSAVNELKKSPSPETEKRLESTQIEIERVKKVLEETLAELGLKQNEIKIESERKGVGIKLAKEIKDIEEDIQQNLKQITGDAGFQQDPTTLPLAGVITERLDQLNMIKEGLVSQRINPENAGNELIPRLQDLMNLFEMVEQWAQRTGNDLVFRKSTELVKNVGGEIKTMGRVIDGVYKIIEQAGLPVSGLRRMLPFGNNDSVRVDALVDNLQTQIKQIENLEKSVLLLTSGAGLGGIFAEMRPVISKLEGQLLRFDVLFNKLKLASKAATNINGQEIKNLLTNLVNHDNEMAIEMEELGALLKKGNLIHESPLFVELYNNFSNFNNQITNSLRFGGSDLNLLKKELAKAVTMLPNNRRDRFINNLIKELNALINR